MEMEVMICSELVIIKDGKVLLVKGEKDWSWKFPGGKVEESDLSDDSSFIILEKVAQREAEEEIKGRGAEIIRPLKTILLPRPNYPGKWIILVHWLAELTVDIKPSSEKLEVKFFDIGKISSEDCGKFFAPNIREVLQDFQQERMAEF